MNDEKVEGFIESKDLAICIPDDTLSLLVTTQGGLTLGMFRRNTKTKEWEFGMAPGSRPQRRR